MHRTSSSPKGPIFYPTILLRRRSLRRQPANLRQITRRHHTSLRRQSTLLRVTNTTPLNISHITRTSTIHHPTRHPTHSPTPSRLTRFRANTQRHHNPIIPRPNISFPSPRHTRHPNRPRRRTKRQHTQLNTTLINTTNSIISSQHNSRRTGTKPRTKRRPQQDRHQTSSQQQTLHLRHSRHTTQLKQTSLSHIRVRQRENQPRSTKCPQQTRKELSNISTRTRLPQRSNKRVTNPNTSQKQPNRQHTTLYSRKRRASREGMVHFILLHDTTGSPGGRKTCRRRRSNQRYPAKRFRRPHRFTHRK